MIRFAAPLAWLALTCFASASEHFITSTFGSGPRVEHGDTLTLKGDVLRVDLSSLPPGTRCVRAVLRVPTQGHRNGVGVRLVPIGQDDAAPSPCGRRTT